jgi:hypothetical protein
VELLVVTGGEGGLMTTGGGVTTTAGGVGTYVVVLDSSVSSVELPQPIASGSAIAQIANKYVDLFMTWPPQFVVTITAGVMPYQSKDIGPKSTIRRWHKSVKGL